jgi:hypothetical protein
MNISTFCFVTSSLAALCGMNLGLYMGIQGDFTLVPVHAHINLLGWVTMSLYGLYHRGIQRESNRLGWIQVGCGTVGFLLMTLALGAYLVTGNGSFITVVIAGALFALTAMVLFLVIVVTDATRRSVGVPIDDHQRAYGW